jgi:predicted ATPase
VPRRRARGARKLRGVTHLAEIRLRRPKGADMYPFTVPAVRALGALSLDAAVTCFVGENGSGKSTLLEGIAAAAGLPSVGSDDLPRDPTLAPARALGRALTLSWTRRTARGFFLRAEDFFGFAKRLSRERAELVAEIEATTAAYREAGRSEWALGLALGPLRNSVAGMDRRYGVDLDANSHGQAFLRLFGSRFVPGGLYLLDEPEAALSPQSQLALLSMLLDMVRQGGQFVIATHSPILLAYPGARLLSFDTLPPAAVAFEELEHVRLTRAFLEDPAAYLRHLVRA